MTSPLPASRAVMEAFLADIFAVFRKYGLIIHAEPDEPGYEGIPVLRLCRMDAEPSSIAVFPDAEIVMTGDPFDPTQVAAQHVCPPPSAHQALAAAARKKGATA